MNDAVVTLVGIIIDLNRQVEVLKSQLQSAESEKQALRSEIEAREKDKGNA